jgi:hypothetical protein
MMAPQRHHAGVTKSVILLTIHAPSWYYQPAKKPAESWSTVLK